MLEIMTRKKQGAPQRLNSENDRNLTDQRCLSSCTPVRESSNNSEIPKQEADREVTCQEREQTCEMEREVRSREKQQEKKTSMCQGPVEETESTSSCLKLFNFTKNFLANDSSNNSKIPEVPNDGGIPSVARRDDGDKVADTGKSSMDVGYRCFANTSWKGQHSLQAESSVLKRQDRDASLLDTHQSVKSAAVSSNDVTGQGKVVHSSRQEDQLKSMPDVESISASQRLIIDAVMRHQKQLYEQCNENWMNVQRSDNNCLSKSKAERYRWCVQGEQQKSSRLSSHSHVSNLKKSASLAGVGVTPVQDKLYSTVFTGASKFCCRDCGNTFNTLVELTVHMNETGHFRDTNRSEKPSTVSGENGCSSNHDKAKKRPLPDDVSHSEKVLTCMGCGHLFESLQDLSVHMMKTKHYEDVPSLRMWSQKQSPQREVASTSRKRSIQSTADYGKNPDFTGPTDSSPVFNGLPSYFSHGLPGMNPSALAAMYANFFYSCPWLASPNAFLPNLYASAAAGFPYPFLFPPGMLPGVARSTSPSVTKIDGSPFSCSRCHESFTSPQKLQLHIQEASHHPHLDQNWFNFFLGSSPASHSPSFPSGGVTPTNGKPTTSSSPNIGKRDVRMADFSSSSHTDSSEEKKDTISSRYIQSTSEANGVESQNCSFDFIKSLETTIQSAISKVKSPHNDDSVLTKNAAGFHDSGYKKCSFAPFSSCVPAKANPPMSVEKCFPGMQQSLSHQEKPHPFNNYHNNCAKTCEKRNLTTNFLRKGSGQGPSPSLNGVKESNPERKVVTLTKPSETDGRKSDSPLDLTVKRDTAAFSSSDCKAVEKWKKYEHEDEINSVKNHSSVLDGKTVTGTHTKNDVESPPPRRFVKQSKTPLQSLHDDMQAFFSLMQSDRQSTVGHHHQTNPTSRSFMASRKGEKSEAYKPLMVADTVADKTVNPLQEILRIVKNTELDRPNGVEQNNVNLPAPPKRHSTGSISPIQPKKAKISPPLQDLLVPNNDPLKGDVNPLLMIRDLVENKLLNHPTKTKFSSFQTAPHLKATSSSLPAVTASFSSDTSLKGCPLTSSTSLNNAASALLTLRSSLPTNVPSGAVSNGITDSGVASPSRGRSSSPPDADELLPSKPPGRAERDNVVAVSTTALLLEAAFVRVFASVDTFDRCENNLVDKLALSRKQIKAWFEKTRQKLTSHGQLPFLRSHGDEGAIEVKCRRCGMNFSSAVQFSQHVESHMDVKNTNGSKEAGIDEDSSTHENPPSRSSLSGKYTIQGSMCIGSYRSLSDTSSPHPAEDCQFSEEDISAKDGKMMALKHALTRHRRTDEVTNADDVITVTS